MPRTKLDPNYWKFVLFHELKGHTQTEIANVLGCSQGTVSNRMKTMTFTLEEMAKMNRAFGLDVEKVVRNF